MTDATFKDGLVDAPPAQAKAKKAPFSRKTVAIDLSLGMSNICPDLASLTLNPTSTDPAMGFCWATVSVGTLKYSQCSVSCGQCAAAILTAFMKPEGPQ